MAGSASLVRNDAGVKALLAGHEAQAFLEKAAKTYADAVVASWPVVTGRSQAFFQGSLSVDPAGPGKVDVNTSDPLWHIIEYGSVNNPPYRPFSVGAQRAGLKYKPVGRP